jgi:ferrous iron transport protein B
MNKPDDAPSSQPLTEGQPSTSARPFVATLVGSPNSGKTTLFNWLTGSNFKTVNYPGATVDHSIGTTQPRYHSTARDAIAAQALTIMDTPGTYSLEPKSPDERVTQAALFSHPEFGASAVVISVVDATHLARHLLVTRQLIECGFRLVLAVTMIDLLRESGAELDSESLSRELGVPVVLIDGRLGGGVQDLVTTVAAIDAAACTAAARKPSQLSWAQAEIEQIAIECRNLASRVITSSQTRQSKLGPVTRVGRTAARTAQIDRWLLHPAVGPILFLAIMLILFTSIFWLAKPAMEAVDQAFSWLGDWVLARDPSSLGLQFLSQGVIASLSAVMVFVPQIFILFVGIILLEDSGYLARSATLIDRPLAAIGLGGRSFVPLLSGFACAVPAMMAARTINSRSERWLTLFITPLMSCSARLPVYALLLSFLFFHQPAWMAGLTLAAIYALSLIIGAIAAVIANRLICFDDPSFFMMELPVYRRPLARHVLRQALSRTRNYVTRAGPAIFTFALVIWLATTLPNARESDATKRLNSSYAALAGRWIEPVFRPMGGDWRTGVGLISAFAAREVFVSSLAVVFQVGDTQVGDTQVGSPQAGVPDANRAAAAGAGAADAEAATADVPARSKETLQKSLLEKMQSARGPDGRALFTLSSVLGLIVFFMIALQCLSTVTMAQRESGSWRFALGQLIVFNGVAYGLAIAIVQGLRACGLN